MSTSRFLRAFAFAALLGCVTLCVAPIVVDGKRRPPRKQRKFVRKGVTYKPYVPPNTTGTTAPQVPPGPPPPPASCEGALIARGWPRALRLTAWTAFSVAYRDGAVLPNAAPACRHVRSFVARIGRQTTGTGARAFDRTWTCYFGTVAECRHYASSGRADLAISFDAPARVTTGLSPGPTPAENNQRLTIGGSKIDGIRRFLVVGTKTCRTSAAEQTTPLDAVLFSDLASSDDIFIRPIRAGQYHACLFLQRASSDERALAVIRARFTWVPGANPAQK